MIGIAAVFLASSAILYKKKKPYVIRNFPQVESLKSSRIDAIEDGLERSVVLGHDYFSSGYPGLGLSSLSAVPGFLDPETRAYGKMRISASDGMLVTFARQIIRNSYHGGFSNGLTSKAVVSSLLGPTPFSYTAGLLNEINKFPEHGLMLIGSFGPEASLWSEVCASKNGYIFASAGTITSQAALYSQVNDLLIGENTFVLPGLINPSPGKTVGWLTEDILRILLISLLIAGAILKMVGVI